MANFSFTQLKTTQVSGSYNDGLSAVSAGFGGIAAADAHLQSTLDHMASSLKRLHGHSGGIANASATIKAPSSTAFVFDLQDDNGLELRDSGGTSFLKQRKASSGVNEIKSVWTSGIAGDLQLSLDHSGITRPSLVLSGIYGGALVVPNSTNPAIGGLLFGDAGRRIGSGGKSQGLNIGADTRLGLSGSNNIDLTVDGSNSGVVKMSLSAATDSNPFGSDPFLEFRGTTTEGRVQAQGSSRALVLRDSGDTSRLSVMIPGDPGVQVQSATPLYFDGGKNHMVFVDSSSKDMSVANVHSSAAGRAQSLLISSTMGGVEIAAGSTQQVGIIGQNIYLGKDTDQILRLDGVNKVWSPASNAEADLGSQSLRWDKVHANYASLTGDFQAQDVFVDANLFVSGTSVSSVFEGDVQIKGTLDVGQINTTIRDETALVVQDAVILAGSGSDSAGAGGVGVQFGGTIGGTTPGKIELGSSGNTFEFDLETTKRLELSSTALLPGSSNAQDLGSNSVQWRDLYVDGIGYIDEVRANDFRLFDEDQSHYLDILFDENASANRELKLTVNNGDRAIDLRGDLELSGAFKMAGANPGLVIKCESSANPALVIDASRSSDILLEQSTTQATVVTYGGLTGSMGVEVRDTTDSTHGGFVKYMDGDNSAHVKLMAPPTVSTSYELKWPTAIGTSGQKLALGGSGQLTFVSDAVTSRNVYAHQMIAAHGADVILDLDTSGSGSAAGAYSTKPTVAGAAPNSYIVFVNGQRMVSGSASANTSGNVDYTLDASAEGSKQIKFSFPLVAGDIIMIDKTTVS